MLHDCQTHTVHITTFQIESSMFRRQIRWPAVLETDVLESGEGETFVELHIQQHVHVQAPDSDIIRDG